MPLTFPAHQGIIIGLKLRWPQYVDGSALCIGAAAPDLAYSLGGWLGSNSHSVLALVVWSVPVTLLFTSLLRWRAAVGIFGHFPDCGPFRLRSFSVLGLARTGLTPLRILRTIASAAIGSASHILIDAFTHRQRWGATWLGLERVLLTIPVRGEISIARGLQYAGHIGGSVAFAVAILYVARQRKLEDWYGAETVRAARRIGSTQSSARIFWAIVAIPPTVAFVVAYTLGLQVIFLPISVLAASLTVAGVITAPSLDSSERNIPAR